VVNTTHEVSIGARKNSGSANYDLNFDGRIDEVAVYNRALSTRGIVAHFNAAFATNAIAGPDTNDVVFGLEVVAVETLPDSETTQVAFNELASSTNSAFWLELINCGRTNVDLGGWGISEAWSLRERRSAGLQPAAPWLAALRPDHCASSAPDIRCRGARPRCCGLQVRAPIALARRPR
jgi:hypothetical protein